VFDLDDNIDIYDDDDDDYVEELKLPNATSSSTSISTLLDKPLRSKVVSSLDVRTLMAKKKQRAEEIRLQQVTQIINFHYSI
jgi:hypothetical protein